MNILTSIKIGCFLFALFVGYAVYFFSTMLLSRTIWEAERMLDQVEKDLDLEQAFANVGAKLKGVGMGEAGKCCKLLFVLEPGSPLVIPKEVDEYISQHPELGEGNAIKVELRIGKGGEWTSARDKYYFPWRIFL